MLHHPKAIQHPKEAFDKLWFVVDISATCSWGIVSSCVSCLNSPQVSLLEAERAVARGRRKIKRLEKVVPSIPAVYLKWKFLDTYIISNLTYIPPYDDGSV